MEHTFEIRTNSSSPRISRLKYNDVYIYLIQLFYGCDCGYIGCDDMKKSGQKIKVRSLDGKLIKSKKGTTAVNLPWNKTISEKQIIGYYNQYY